MHADRFRRWNPRQRLSIARARTIEIAAAIACAQLGLPFVGCDIDDGYLEDATRRITGAVAAVRLDAKLLSTGGLNDEMPNGGQPQ
jgi:hypothetical protein